MAVPKSKLSDVYKNALGSLVMLRLRPISRTVFICCNQNASLLCRRGYEIQSLKDNRVEG